MNHRALRSLVALVMLTLVMPALAAPLQATTLVERADPADQVGVGLRPAGALHR